MMHMRDFPEMVVDGARLVMHAIGAKEALVGIEDNKPEAVAAMEVEDFPAIVVMDAHGGNYYEMGQQPYRRA